MPFCRHILLYLLLLAGSGTRSQSLYFRSYSVQQGLSGNCVTSILQDRRGFMWFGTRNGLNRFDGTAFRIFRNNPPDSLSIGSNSVSCLYEDESGLLWVGTHKGIYRYNARQETFSPFAKLPQIDVRSITQDCNKNVWIIAVNSIYRYAAKSGKLEKYAIDNATTLRLSAKGELWIGTNKGSIEKYDAHTNQFISIITKPDNIRDIYPLTDSTLMVGSQNQVYEVNITNGSSRNIFSRYPWSHDLKVKRIFRQSDSMYWIGCESGLYTYNSKTGEGNRIQKEQENPHSITDNTILSINRDTEGGTWVGTFYGGVNYYSPQYNKFQKFVQHSGLGTGFKGNIVHEIITDKAGNLWVGTEDAGLNKIDVKTGSVKNFTADNAKKIHGLLAAGDELWIGTLDKGLSVMDLKTEKIIRHYQSGPDSNSIKSNFIVSLFRSKNGDILVGTSNGMFRYNRLANNFSLVSGRDMHIQSVYEDKQHTTWVGTYGKGVYYSNSLTGKKDSIRHASNSRNSLVNDYVLNVFEDSKGNLWFCTEEGLSKYNATTKKFRNYTTADGLPDNQVFRVLEDDQGFIWISTSHGLVQMNPVTESLRKYGTASGLISEQFNYNSAMKKGSTLFFGTVKGLIGFNPAEFIPGTFIPPVYITNIHVNNKEVDFINEGPETYLSRDGIKSGLSGNTSVTFLDHITLAYNQSDLSFSVAALSYAAPERNEYLYKLDGVNQEWIHLKENREIFYTKLPPGNYTFRVKGSNGNEHWNPKETRMRITITPPWWQSPWAYLIYALIILAIVITIARYYHIAMKEKNRRKMEAFEREKEREIYHAKIEFFTNITHEIRTPLTLIKLPIDQLMKKIITDEEIKTGLHMINKNTNRLIDLSNQLLDFRKAEANNYSLSFVKSNVSDLLTEEFRNFKLAAEQKGLSFKLELCRIEPHAYLDPEAFKKILTNLVSNAIKYALATVVIKLLPFGSEDDLLHIEFRSDGEIIPAALKDKIFEPFFRINESGKESGTGIGLPLAKSLAELHKGTLTLKQPDHMMNVFLLSLPVEQQEAINFDRLEPSAEEEELTSNDAEDNLKASILIVEDNREISGFLHKSLKNDYRVFQAFNGLQALELLQKENIGLVVSDVMMPVMDGIELCRKIKTDLQYSHVPVILLTAKNTLDAKITGLENGADAYIEKPFALEHLQAQISNLIANREKIKEYFASSPLTHMKGIACSKPDRDFLEKLNGIIHANLGVPELDVEQLSLLMNMSRSSLYRKIKVLSNLAPHELITLSRLKHAAALLRDGQTVSEVSTHVGYSLQSNFSRDFHKQFGVTPTAYVKGLQEGLILAQTDPPYFSAGSR